MFGHSYYINSMHYNIALARYINNLITFTLVFLHITLKLIKWSISKNQIYVFFKSLLISSKDLESLCLISKYSDCIGMS